MDTDSGNIEPSSMQTKCRGCGREFKSLLGHISRSKVDKCKNAYSSEEKTLMGQQSRKNTIKNYNLKNRSQINERQRQYDKKNKEKKQMYNKAKKI